MRAHTTQPMATNWLIRLMLVSSHSYWPLPFSCGKKIEIEIEEILDRRIASTAILLHQSWQRRRRRRRWRPKETNNCRHHHHYHHHNVCLCVLPFFLGRYICVSCVCVCACFFQYTTVTGSLGTTTTLNRRSFSVEHSADIVWRSECESRPIPCLHCQVPFGTCHSSFFWLSGFPSSYNWISISCTGWSKFITAHHQHCNIVLANHHCSCATIIICSNSLWWDDHTIVPHDQGLWFRNFYFPILFYCTRNFYFIVHDQWLFYERIHVFRLLTSTTSFILQFIYLFL